MSVIRVLIDATGVTRNKAGVGVYGKSLLDTLVAKHAATPTLDLFLLVQDDDPDFAFRDTPGITVIPVPSRFLRRIPLRLLFEQALLPLLLLYHRIDVLHSLHYSFPLLRLGRTRSVVTVHDMTFFSMPEVHTGIKIRFYRFFLRRGRTWADALIFISRSTQEDYIRLLGAPKCLSTVIHHGKGSAFHPIMPHQQHAMAVVRTRYGLPNQYVLYVGTIEPRKNLDRLVEAFASIAPRFPDAGLVLAGMMGWKQEHLPARVQELGLQSRILFPGFVAEEDKPLLIAGCTAFVYPSLYEGFGLPVLEALACGAPTITSNTSSLPEVAGDSALLVNPLDTNALAEAMNCVLASPALQQELHDRGLVQAGEFNWEYTANATIEVYRRLLES